MIAETVVGRGDKAFDYYTRINPSAREEISELHKCEPYVYAQMIAGKDAAKPRRSEELLADRHCRMELCGDHTIYPWHSARASMGLEVKPVIPSDWDGFEVTRNFRGVRYEISVKRKGPGNNVSLEVDGKSIEGTVIPLPRENTKTVKVRLSFDNKRVNAASV